MNHYRSSPGAVGYDPVTIGITVLKATTGQYAVSHTSQCLRENCTQALQVQLDGWQLDGWQLDELQLDGWWLEIGGVDCSSSWDTKWMMTDEK
jgi:hypothetical protein